MVVQLISTAMIKYAITAEMLNDNILEKLRQAALLQATKIYLLLNLIQRGKLYGLLHVW